MSRKVLLIPQTQLQNQTNNHHKTEQSKAKVWTVICFMDYKRSDIPCNCEMGFEVESSVPNQMHWVTQRTSRQLTKHIRLWALFWKEDTDINGKMLAAQNMTLKGFIPRGKTRCAHTPSLKQLIPGSEGPFLETCFFLHFSLRLSGNNCSRVISMGNFGPTASNLRYEILTNFWVKIRVLVRPHLWSWTGFDLLIILGVKFWWFSFFYFPSRSSGNWSRPTLRLIRNWRHFRNQW